MKPLPHSRMRLHFPNLFDRDTNRVISIANFRARWVASRSRVFRTTTTETIIANAGFCEGVRHGNR
jgi:hypothetical protein